MENSTQNAFFGTKSGWVKHPASPVLGGELGTCFDVAVMHDEGVYRMWVSWRPTESIALTESTNGIHWSDLEIVLGPNLASGWEKIVNRPSVVKRPDGYHMWYTGMEDEGCVAPTHIGYATSPDGKHWTRYSDTPVMTADAPWEFVAVMCPDVQWDEALGLYRMWYSGGQDPVPNHEPDSIGYATSPDGIHWTKYPANPIFKADPANAWERKHVTACQVVKHGDEHYMFYIGFQDLYHCAIGIARSKDGVTNWERHPENPVIASDQDGWDGDACYKPYVIYKDGNWLLWYNGRLDALEQIGFVIHEGEDLGF